MSGSKQPRPKIIDKFLDKTKQFCSKNRLESPGKKLKDYITTVLCILKRYVYKVVLTFLADLQ